MIVQAVSSANRLVMLPRAVIIGGPFFNLGPRVGAAHALPPGY